MICLNNRTRHISREYLSFSGSTNPKFLNFGFCFCFLSPLHTGSRRNSEIFEICILYFVHHKDRPKAIPYDAYGVRIRFFQFFVRRMPVFFLVQSILMTNRIQNTKCF